MISLENRQLLHLLAEASHGGQPHPIEAENWPAIQKELTAQTVLAIPMEHVGASPLSMDQKQAYAREVSRLLQQFYLVMQEQEQVLDAFRAAGIRRGYQRGVRLGDMKQVSKTEREETDFLRRLGVSRM